MEKNKKNQLRNIASSLRAKQGISSFFFCPSVCLSVSDYFWACLASGVRPTLSEQKVLLDGTLTDTRASTASLGRFDKKLKDEPKEKKRGIKRKVFRITIDSCHCITPKINSFLLFIVVLV